MKKTNSVITLVTLAALFGLLVVVVATSLQEKVIPVMTAVGAGGFFASGYASRNAPGNPTYAKGKTLFGWVLTAATLVIAYSIFIHEA
jgi:hypothetical protein